MNDVKECPHCKKSLSVADFYADRVRKDGLFWCCKACAKERKYAWMKRVGYVRTEGYRAMVKAAGYYTYAYRKDSIERYEKKNPDKIKARKAVKAAVSAGELKKGACSRCGSEKVQAHHHAGYEMKNWLKVTWLCQKHHSEEHRNLRVTTNKI